jgi:hypothetical protein
VARRRRLERAALCGRSEAADGLSAEAPGAKAGAEMPVTRLAPRNLPDRAERKADLKVRLYVAMRLMHVRSR